MPDSTLNIQVMSRREVPLVLVVDDDVVIRNMLFKALQRHEYDVIEAPNGSEAVELFGNYHPDLVLLDVLMPMMNGFEACEAMRKLDPENIVPILMLTGLDDVSSVDRAFEAGATDFITKPINWSLFIQRVRYALKSRNLDFALRKSRHRIRHALKVAKLGYWDWDLQSDTFVVPDSVLQMLNIDVPPGGLNRETFVRLSVAEDRDKVTQAFERARQYGENFAIENRIITRDGLERYVFQQCDVILEEDQPRHVLGTIQDVTALKRAEEMILHQAYHDLLTDLPNQVLFKDRLGHALKLAEQVSGKVAVLAMDIDRFQVINESLGHEAGDILLVEFAGFLCRYVTEGDTVSRISGNEFAILVENLRDMEQVNDIIRGIRTHLHAQAFELNNEKVYVTASIGVAIYPDDDFDAESLIQCASAALRKAKSQGGDQECFYTTDMNRRIHDRLQLERDLRESMESGGLEVYYQPQLDLQSHRIIAMEALVRWNHPQMGLIPPIRFIPLAEETGLINKLGHDVLDQAMQKTRHWNDMGYELRVGINMSARQFMQADLVQQIESLLQKNQLEPRYVDLEITETIAMQDAEKTIEQMHQLKQLGVHLSLDDFGTGYSSLSYLHRFPLDVLKIDRSFVKDIEGRDGDGEIARAVIAMAKSMNMEVIAEGVEDHTQLEFLRHHGCNLVQGYLISRPVKADDFEALLTSPQHLPPDQG